MSRTLGASKRLERIPVPQYFESHVWVRDPEIPQIGYGVQLENDYEGTFLLPAAIYDMPLTGGATAIRGLSAYIETLPDGSIGRNDTQELIAIADIITKNGE